MKHLSFLDKLLYLVNSLLSALLLLSFVLPYISPKTLPQLAIISLFVPALIIINTGFLIYWLIKLKKAFIVSFVSLALGYFVATPFIKFTGKTSAYNTDITVMSYNVKTFDWFTNTDANTNNGFAFIKDKNPDILAIQEYYVSSKTDINYPHKYIKLKRKNSKYGMAIYSKFKIINTGSFNFKSIGNNIIYADILKDKDTIRVYNVHFESLRLKPDEKNFGQENSERLIASFKRSFKQQAQQAEQLIAHEKEWSGKKIICGDFNNTAYSWLYKTVANGKKDAFIDAGKGFGKTYNYWFPIRIDVILSNDNSIINRFDTFSVNYSDHYPIMARVNWY